MADASFSTGPSAGFPPHDHIAGHEGIGRVVQSYDPALLGRVVGIRYLGGTCGCCAYCARGLPTSCAAQLNIPKHVGGTFQEYATVPTSCLVALPHESIQDEGAAATTTAGLCAALCSGSAALMALRAAGIVDGAGGGGGGGKVVVVVSGVGGAIGHLAGAMARRVFGARVVGVDVGPKCDVLRAMAGLDQAGDYYADVLLDAPREATGEAWTDFAAELGKACTALRGDREETPRMADALVVCAGEPDAFRNLDGYVCDGGRIVCVG
ncbi:hypothetical protein SLS55_010675 [Diplodia seriata]|uniref:Alcohol dehydrogenase-like N-terminal domain-containing protein n=1 Tax=Diplodia seriata TaxID=420778 RepID=A0ABR3BX85_9PEZI